MPLPIPVFTDHAKRFLRAIRLRRVPRELLVAQVRVVLELTGRFNDVDPDRSFADGEFRSQTAASSVAVW